MKLDKKYYEEMLNEICDEVSIPVNKLNEHHGLRTKERIVKKLQQIARDAFMAGAEAQIDKCFISGCKRDISRVEFPEVVE